MYKFVVRKCHSEKKSRDYVALVADLGYRSLILLFNSAQIAEVCGMSIRELTAYFDSKPVGTEFEVAAYSPEEL